MKKLGFMLLLLAFSTLFFNTAPSVYASSFELAHDDGNADYGWSDFYPYAAMVRFSPPSASWRITAVRLHATCVLRGAQVFYVQIWDAGLNTVYWSAFLPSSVFKNATLDWYTISLPNVVVTGDFYVVVVSMFTLDGTQLWISIDDDPPFSNNSFIVNVGEHTIHASLNATSKRPGDFMIRVVGEPVPTPPELRLASIEAGVDETVLTFTYPGELAGFGARLVKPDGSSVEENVTRVGESLVVRTGGEGLLNVFVVAKGFGRIGTSIRLNHSLRTAYRELFENYTALKHDVEEMLRQIDSLKKDKRARPFIHAEVYQALGEPKVGAWFTVVTRLDGREVRIAAELAAKQVGEYTVHRLAPAREGSFTVLEAERFVEVYPGWSDINLIIKTGIGEGGEIKYTVQNPDADYIRSIGEGFYEIAYWRLGEPSVEHHRVRGLYSSTSAICFPSDGEGTYVIRLVRRVDEAFLLSLYNGPGQLSYSGGKYFLNLYGVTLTGESKYSHGIAGGMGGVEIVFPFFSEGEHAESLAVVSTVNDQGEWSSRIGYGSGREGWRYVYSMPPPSDENGYRVFKIFFGEDEPQGAAYVKYDPSTGGSPATGYRGTAPSSKKPWEAS